MPIDVVSMAPTNATEMFNRESISSIRNGASRAAVIAAMVIGVLAIIAVVAAVISRKIYIIKRKSTDDSVGDMSTPSVSKGSKSDHTSDEGTITTL
jgi:hypothetical protein